VTQQNAALVEVATAAAQSLQEQAGGLTQVVSVFRRDHASHKASSYRRVVHQVAGAPKLSDCLEPN